MLKAGTKIICPKCNGVISTLGRDIYPGDSPGYRDMVFPNGYQPKYGELVLSPCCKATYSIHGKVYTEKGWRI